MKKLVMMLGVLTAGTGCVHTTDMDRDRFEMDRIEYLETVYLPASEACSKAGGFMILEDPVDVRGAPRHLSYSNMRLAVARGCGGI